MLKWIIVAALAISGPLAAETKVLALAGSTRKDSNNKKLVREAAELARHMGASVTIIDLSDYPIPFYDGDLETTKGMPDNAKRIRSMMVASNAIIVASPEYNGSVSAVLKNMIDWASRSEKGGPSRQAFAGKKFAIMSSSPGQGGGARSLKHLQEIIENVGGEVVPKMVSVPNANSAFNAQGRLANPDMERELSEEIQQLLQH
jgi:chromate reductase, NAD(P)H dehydrogenase (quinone)